MDKVIKVLYGIIKVLLCILLIVFLLGLPVIIGIMFSHNKDVVIHKYFVEDADSHLIYRPVCDSTTHNYSETTIDGCLPNEMFQTNSDSERISIFDNILDITGNTISYFSAIIAALALIAGIAMWKYYRKILTTEERIKKLNNSLLDNALITLYAVPFVEATQITSSEHLKAIRYISESINNRDEDLESDSKYAPLLLCKGLYNYFEGNYKEAIHIMERAYRLSKFELSFRPVVSFHLARTYKQYAYTETMKSSLSDSRISEIEQYIEKALYYNDNSPEWLKNSLTMSILAIRAELANKKNDPARFSVNKNELKQYLEKFVSSPTALDQTLSHKYIPYSFDRMTAIPLLLQLKKDEGGEFEDLYRNAAKDFIEYMKSRLQGHSGDNIRVSWYFSMARVCFMIEEYKQARIYLDLAYSHYVVIEKIKSLKTLFAYDCLSEIDKNVFFAKMGELNEQLKNQLLTV